MLTRNESGAFHFIPAPLCIGHICPMRRLPIYYDKSRVDKQLLLRKAQHAADNKL